MSRKTTHRSRPVQHHTYSKLDILSASPTQPMPAYMRTHQLTRMWLGLAAIETAPAPSKDDWLVCSDPVNLLETLVEHGIYEDASGLLDDAIKALAIAIDRHKTTGHPIRLNGQGVITVRTVLEEYAEAIATIPHRAAIEMHRLTETRIWGIFKGKRQAKDLKVIDV